MLCMHIWCPHTSQSTPLCLKQRNTEKTAKLQYNPSATCPVLKALLECRYPNPFPKQTRFYEPNFFAPNQTHMHVLVTMTRNHSLLVCSSTAWTTRVPHLLPYATTLHHFATLLSGPTCHCTHGLKQPHASPLMNTTVHHFRSA